MNRIIKFKAWHKGIKKMVLVTKLNWNTIGNEIDPRLWSIDGIGETKTKDGKDTDILVKQEDFELLQFTGLKDKNGKEIYEGDIVNKFSAKGWRIGRVIFNHGAFVVKYPHIHGWKLLNERGQGASEVIGNIFDNPELLKGGE